MVMDIKDGHGRICVLVGSQGDTSTAMGRKQKQVLPWGGDGGKLGGSSGLSSVRELEDQGL